MKRYNSYKDSGIQWLGEIPAHWEVKRGKDFLKITSGFPADSDLFSTDETDVPLVRIRDINNTKTEIYYKGEYPKWAELNCGDLLIGMDGDFNVAFWKGQKAILNQRVCKLDSRKLNLKYIYYSISFPLNELNAKTNSTTVKHLSVSGIQSFFFAVPSLAEQQEIADYLDVKCGEIDAAIGNIEQQVKAYERLKTSLINRAVTRGLNPDTPLRPSGIDHLGDIPEHWEVKRVKDLISLCSGDTITATQLDETGSFPVYGGNGIRGSHNEYNRDGDYILIGRVGALCGNIHLVHGKFWATEHALIGTPVNQFNLSWLSYKLERMNLGQYSQSTAQPVITQAKISSLHIPTPPFEEQQEIADYLDVKSGEIDAAIANINEQIKAYERLKRSLINEVVTGKIAVNDIQ